MRLILATIAAGALATLPVEAAVQTINFSDEAEIGGERTLVNGEIFTSSTGARIRITAGDADDDRTLPFLDGEFEGRPGGLGVCVPFAGVGSQCLTSDLDNIGPEMEFVELGFLDDDGTRLFALMDISFNDRFHFDVNPNALVNVSVDGGATLAMTFAAVIAAANSGAYAAIETLRLSYIEGSERFYIESISEIPVPGALPLLLSGLAGLGFAARKKRAA